MVMNNWRNSSRILALVLWCLRHGVVNSFMRFRNRKLFVGELTQNFVPGNTSVSDSDNFQDFLNICGSAASDPKVFSRFRRGYGLAEVVDNVSLEQGKGYIREITRQANWSDDYTKVLRFIDSLGNPRKYFFRGKGFCSPTSLRYLKVFVDLHILFGSTDDFEIAEIGVGFGGQASLILSIDKPSSYSFFDIEPVLALSKSFVENLGLGSKFNWCDGRNPERMNPDLVISNYAFSELSRGLQEIYLKNVIIPSKRGYITWNSSTMGLEKCYSIDELIRLIPNSRIKAEVPNTAASNVIIYWGPNL
jgi:hypothetical protein